MMVVLSYVLIMYSGIQMQVYKGVCVMYKACYNEITQHMCKREMHVSDQNMPSEASRLHEHYLVVANSQVH